MGKRDDQKRNRELKQQQARNKDKTNKMLAKVGLYGVVPLVILFAIYAVLSQGTTYSTVEIADNDHVRGSTSTPVTMVIYADFQCPACANEERVVSRALRSLGDKVHVVFRHYPITDMHPHAWTAATYAEAAGRQGKFWEMHDLLFRTQQQWSFRPANEVSAQFDSYAQQLQLDLDQLKEDIDLREVAQKIRTDQLGGNKAGVRSTPAMFLNGTMINSGISATDLIAKVDEIIVDLN